MLNLVQQFCASHRERIPEKHPGWKDQSLKGNDSVSQNTHCNVKLEARKLVLGTIAALSPAYVDLLVRKISILFPCTQIKIRGYKKRIRLLAKLDTNINLGLARDFLTKSVSN
jgi:hypothetical protein